MSHGRGEVVSTDDVRLVPVDEWDAFVSAQGGADTYLTAAYQQISALLEPPGTRPVLLHLRCGDDDAALPLLLRPLPNGSGWDATTAYGYGGPVSRGPVDGAQLGRALDCWARTNGVVTTFLRLHPALRNAGLTPPTADVIQLGTTVAWDVSAGRDLRAHLHPHHRRAARRAADAGLEITVDPEPASLDVFQKLYEATMRRQDADPFFLFPDEYWTELLRHSSSLAPVLVEGRLDGEVVAALLCLTKEPWLHYHLGGSSDLARRFGASNGCFLAAAEWAQQQGLTGFHLGAGVGGTTDSSLYVFKHRFDPAGPRLPFSIAKLVHDPDRYRELSGTTSTDGFFPPWRRT